MSSIVAPGPEDIAAAARRIAPLAVRTPVLVNEALDAELGARLYFKTECLQRGGAFKFRGACNAVFSLPDEVARRGIVTQSSGNHGTAIAIAARLRGVPSYVVVPRNAPAIKLAQIRDNGANVILCDPSMAARDAECARVLAETGGELIHPYHDARVIAGQGTATRELLEDVPDLDIVMAPVSGGGLLSGMAIAAHAVRPDLRVLGGEPEQARDAFESLRQDRRITDMTPDTIADGLRAYLGPTNFEILRAHRVEVVLASERAIIDTTRRLWDRLKLVIEPSSAVPVAALMATRERWQGLRIGVILSGGNVDLDRLPWQ